jgi:hypothetical protein
MVRGCGQTRRMLTVGDHELKLGDARTLVEAFVSIATTETVTGLTAEKSYTFKVSAKNARGTGLQSAASNAVTPT